MLDISAIFAFEDIIERLKSQQIHILLVIPNDAVITQLKTHGIITQIGDEQVFQDEILAINVAKEFIKELE